MTDSTLREQLGEQGALRYQIERCFIGHNFPNTEIVKRLEALCQEIAREARWQGAVESAEAYIIELKKGQAELTQKPPTTDTEKQ